MKSKKILLEIIEQLEAFENIASTDDKELSMDEFIRFLQSGRPLQNRHNDIVDIAQNISLLHRYSKFYIKKALEGSLLQTVDEYTYLVTLFSQDSLSKTEINNRNVIEKTSGNEIMKRLLQAHLIDERQDSKDKRRKRVSITDKGRAELNKVFPKLWLSATMLTGILSTREKYDLLHISEKLRAFHHPIFIKAKGADIENLIKMLPETD